MFAASADFEGDDLRDLLNLSTEVIIEEYIEGLEYSVECVVQSGVTEVLGITEKLVPNDGFFNEVDHFFPAELPIEIADRVRERASEVNSALKIQNSITHLEMRVS